MRISSGASWTDPAWRDAADRWVADRLAELGRAVTGPIEQPHVMAWSTALRVPTDTGTVWLKADAPGSAYEAALMQLLADADVPHALRPLAVDVERGWLLLPDGGPTLREQGCELEVWQEVLPRYAELQRATAPLTAAMIRAGTPDLRPARMPELLGRLLDDPVALLVGEPDSITPDRLAAVRARTADFATWCDELSAGGLPPTLQHDDLHDGNVLRPGGAWTFFDWSDASVAHPFGTLLVTLRSAAHRRALAEGAPELLRLRDAYLEAWTDLHDRAGLIELARLAMRVAKVGRSLSWQRALAHLPPADRGESANAVGGWIDDLIEPDPF